MKYFQSSYTTASANSAEASFACANIARLDAVIMASIIIFCVSLLVLLITQLG